MKSRIMTWAILLATTCVTETTARWCRAAEPAASLSAMNVAALDRLPVREITVFKDGHAFVLHEGRMATDDAGHVIMDHLPAPVIGTFWPYASEPNVQLTAVVAGKRRVEDRRVALNLRDMLEANIGAEAVITETNRNSYAAKIVGIPKQAPKENDGASAGNANDTGSATADFILLDMHEGVKVVPLNRIQDVVFKQAPGRHVTSEARRDML